MKKLTAVLLFILFQVAAFCEPLSNHEKITVSKIRVYLNDEEIFETTSDSNQSNAIKYETILSFTSIRPGQHFSINHLKREAQQTEYRLMNSGLFYNAKVEIRESRKEPGNYIVYITVTKGFLMRFGGGSIYGAVGKAGIGGNKNQLMGYFGWNLFGGSYINENSFNLPLILGGELFTNAPAGFLPDRTLTVSGKLKTGAFITPDLKICADTYALINLEKGCTEDFIISPFVSLKKYISQKYTIFSELRAYYVPLLDNGTAVEGIMSQNYSPVKFFTIAGFLAAGSDIHNYAPGFNLNPAGAFLSDTPALSNRGIRAGYSESELQVGKYAMATLELRFNIPEFTIPPFIPCQLVPYVFSDFAWATTRDSENRILDGFGAGIQVNLTCPIFAYFNFAYGVNHSGKGKFIFVAKQSF